MSAISSGLYTQRNGPCSRIFASTSSGIVDSIGVSGELYPVLMRKPGEFPSMEVVAEALRTTTRTLWRRLESEGTSFVAIVDDVRCSLAAGYLKMTRKSTDDIAMLLGFSDPANFRRALKRWTGKGPVELRS